MKIFEAIMAFPAIIIEEFLDVFRRVKQDEIEIIHNLDNEDEQNI